MVELLERMGTSIPDTQNKHLTEDKIRFPFSSKRKRMSTVLENLGMGGYDKRLHMKGASEIVMGECCSHYMNADGEVLELND